MESDKVTMYKPKGLSYVIALWKETSWVLHMPWNKKYIFTK